MSNISHSALILLSLMSSVLVTQSCAKKTLPPQIDKHCVSNSGMSKYLIKINTSMKTGTIRYQFMGQDVLYVVLMMEIDGSIISGLAEFQSSLTGEVRGSPISFRYDNDTGMFKDGEAISNCYNI